MSSLPIQPGVIVSAPFLSEPVEVIAVDRVGSFTRIQGRGLGTNTFRSHQLTTEQIAQLIATKPLVTFSGDARTFKLAVEAHRLRLAYEYDPFFSLSIARVDPLPHQLEAVYDYFLRTPRIRFLLADDPGAGKTIMAGLLLKELKIRELVRRVLILTPANLTFQWEREMADKFRERFRVLRGGDLRDTYGVNPWQEYDQVITSVSWVSVIEDARESLLRSRWDLIIVDEAHKMSAQGSERTTLAYQLGMQLSERTDHYLLMTATPHKGDPEGFRRFLSLLDRDVYGDIASLKEALRRNSAPFYLRRTKEALVTFPDPATGQVKRIYTNRRVETIDFAINSAELDFYDALTYYVEEQSARAAAEDSARGRALGFTMAMLQRRFASSTRAVRRSLERMKESRERILADPDAYYRQQVERKLPDDFDELDDDDREAIYQELEKTVVAPNPGDLRRDIAELSQLILRARELEEREIETKLVKLRETLQAQGIFDDPTMRLLIFTEHKETLDYLVEKLRGWGLTVTQIFGGMKPGDRNSPGTRLYAEREFRESCQVMVATEAAGEGINLQFCWFMINYDIPWNPTRLEQRMGRIHRYGQERDCLILNFVASNTREGRVFQKLFERISLIERDLDPEQTGKVFNVLGDVFPSNQLEKLLREMYARNQTEQTITDRIVADVDTTRFRKITESALEGLAKRSLNLTALVGRQAEARERRLVPEVIQSFFLESAPLCGLQPSPVRRGGPVYRVGEVPFALRAMGDRLERRFGKLGEDYGKIAFDKQALTADPTLEWVTPGHPLFEAVRQTVQERGADDMARGAVFFELGRETPAVVDIYTAAIRDGRDHLLHERLALIQTEADGRMQVRQPTLFLDLQAAPEHPAPPDLEPPQHAEVEAFLMDALLEPLLREVAGERAAQVEQVRAHAERSLDALIDRAQQKYATLEQQRDTAHESGYEGRLKMAYDEYERLVHHKQTRLDALNQERECAIADVRLLGRALILPHPHQDDPDVREMVSDADVERIAVQVATAALEAEDWEVQTVEAENRGYDLLARRGSEVRFVEVKGRAGVGTVILSRNEYATAQRLAEDYWLYVVFNCAKTPDLHTILNPARLGWQPVQVIEHYQVASAEILQHATE